MKLVHRLLGALRRDAAGAVAIEFAILGSAMITMLLGIFQIGTTMQTYNSLRSLNADVARHAVVVYQEGNELTTAELETWARSRAITSYRLQGEGLLVTVSPGEPTGIAGTQELTIDTRAQVTSFMSIIGLRDFYIYKQNSIFVTDS